MEKTIMRFGRNIDDFAKFARDNRMPTAIYVGVDTSKDPVEIGATFTAARGSLLAECRCKVRTLKSGTPPATIAATCEEIKRNFAQQFRDNGIGVIPGAVMEAVG